MVASDADIHALFTCLLRYRLHAQAQYNTAVSAAQSSSLSVLTSLKLIPSLAFISQLSSAPYISPLDDSVQASALHLLHFTAYDAPAKHIAPFAAFATEHYVVSILATQVVGASLRLQHGIAAAPAARYAFTCSELTVAALRCMAFLASNIKLPHTFLRPDPLSAPSSGVAACLRGFDAAADAAGGRYAADSPQARLRSMDVSLGSLGGDLSPADILNMLCDEHTPYVMTTADMISADGSGICVVKRCAFGRMLLMEPFLLNAVSLFLHDSSTLQQLPRFAPVSNHSILGTRVEFGRCAGIVSASFCWDGPIVVDGGIKHHPSMFCFAAHNAVDCELTCLSLLISAAEVGHGWFTHSADGGSQFYSARGCILALANPIPRAAPFLQKTQQPGPPSSSDALHLSLKLSLLRARAHSSDSLSQHMDQPHTPRTPRSRRDDADDVHPLSPHFMANLATESAALVVGQ